MIVHIGQLGQVVFAAVRTQLACLEIQRAVADVEQQRMSVEFVRLDVDHVLGQDQQASDPAFIEASHGERPQALHFRVALLIASIRLDLKRLPDEFEHGLFSQPDGVAGGVWLPPAAIPAEPPAHFVAIAQLVAV
jgi:hypothetical protein